jgi:hypothetical protein
MKLALCLAVVAFAPVLAHAQQPAPAAPVPAPILSAQKVFVANGGVDLVSSTVLTRDGRAASDPYNAIYAALKDWGHWQLLSTPDGADLVLVVRLSAPVVEYSSGTPLVYAPQLQLTLLDGKSAIPLWTILQPISSAFKKATWEKNYADGIEGAVQQLKTVASGAAQQATPQTAGTPGKP